MDDKIKIVCYGDSNTWGYISGSNHERLTKSKRWTGILQELLGDEYEIIEEGLNSRTLISEDLRPGKEGKNGSTYLIPCLDTHDPIDSFILMLGTNELKATYNKTALEIGEILEKYFIKVITNRKSQFLDKFPKLIIVAPPIVNEKTEYCKNKYEGAYLKSLELNNIYKKLSEKYNCKFVNNDNLSTGIDGAHLNEESHFKLAQKIEEALGNNSNSK